MSRAVLILASQPIKAKAHAWIDAAPWNTRVTFQGPRRTVPQNARMWAMLTDISTQVGWHGIKLSPEDWKLMFLDSLKREVRMVPNLDGNGFVSLGRSSSDLDKAEMSDLMEIISAWGAANGVTFTEPSDQGDGVPEDADEAEIMEDEQDAVGAPLDPLEWATRFNQSLADYTDPDALLKDWQGVKTERAALKDVSPGLYQALLDAVAEHGKALRK